MLPFQHNLHQDYNIHTSTILVQKRTRSVRVRTAIVLHGDRSSSEIIARALFIDVSWPRVERTRSWPNNSMPGHRTYVRPRIILVRIEKIGTGSCGAMLCGRIVGAVQVVDLSFFFATSKHEILKAFHHMNMHMTSIIGWSIFWSIRII